MKWTHKSVVDALKANGSVLVASPSIVDDLVRLLDRYYVQDKRPLYVYCNATSAKCGMTSIACFIDRIKQFGSLENLLFKYKGKRGAAKKIKMIKGRPVAASSPQVRYDMTKYIIAIDKNDNAKYRTEIRKFDPAKPVKGGVLILAWDFDELSGGVKYVVGDRGYFNKTHSYVRKADRNK